MLAFGSTAASPGVSTLAVLLAAASPRPAVVVEADPDGGCLGARFDLVDEPGLVTLAAATRRGVDTVRLVEHAQPLTTSTSVVVAPPSGRAVSSVLVASAEALAATLRAAVAFRAVVDCGRLAPTSAAWPLAQAAELVVLVARPRLDEARRLPSRVEELQNCGASVGVVLVGDGPYAPAEVAQVAQVELLGVIADDPRAAAMVNGSWGSDRALRRSRLWRSVVALAEVLDARLASIPDSRDDVGRVEDGRDIELIDDRR